MPLAFPHNATPADDKQSSISVSGEIYLRKKLQSTIYVSMQIYPCKKLTFSTASNQCNFNEKKIYYFVIIINYFVIILIL